MEEVMNREEIIKVIENKYTDESSSRYWEEKWGNIDFLYDIIIKMYQVVEKNEEHYIDKFMTEELELIIKGK